MTDEVKVLSDDALREIEARANAATEGVWEWTYHPDRHDSVIALESMAKEVDVLLCTGDSNGDAWGDISEANAEFMAHAREDIPALCATVRALRAERNGILTNMTEMNQIRALDKNAWRRVGETLGLTEAESAHTSHVLAVLAGRITKYEQLQSQLAQVTQERERKLVQVLDDFRSRNIRRFDLIEALWKAELITKEQP